jgi:hypothetical protein
MIASVFPIILCVSVGWVEYNAVMGLGIVISTLASAVGMISLLGALLLAPEGYEDEDGFHIGALTRATLR